MNTRITIALLTLVLTAMLTGAAAADVLWDQTEGYEGWTMGFFNNIAGAPPFGSTMYTVNDVVVPADGWFVDSIEIYYDGFNPAWATNVTSATLFVEPKTGSLPTGDPTSGESIVVFCVVMTNGFLKVKTENLGLVLFEGEYWLGMTPNTPNSDNIHVSVAAVGDDSPTYDAFGMPAPMWSNWAPGLDGAMLIEGSITSVGTEDRSLGSLKALFR